MAKKSQIVFSPLRIKGSFALATNSVSDERGSLTRIWDNNIKFEKFTPKEISIVKNPKIHTLRGLHYQEAPHNEGKIVVSIEGKVFDVILDLRLNSKSYGEHLAIEIGPTSKFQGLIIPKGCAHGYLTLKPNSTLVYFMDTEYSTQSTRGILWSDPTLKINWPSEPKVISTRDLNWPRLHF